MRNIGEKSGLREGVKCQDEDFGLWCTGNAKDTVGQEFKERRVCGKCLWLCVQEELEE